MNRNKIFILGIIYAASVAAGVTSKPKNAWSLECPFDSYMILDSKCIDLTKKSNVNTNTVHRTIYKNDYENESDAAGRLPEKTCEDFEYQKLAQRYFDRNSEYKSKFDSDNDGYVCEDLTRTDNDILTQKIWQTLKQHSYESSLSLMEANRIIGFNFSLKKKNNRYVWEDKISNRSIEIRFFNGRSREINSRGF